MQLGYAGGHDRDNWETLHKVMKWDLEWAFRGEFADRNHNGNKWPRGTIELNLLGKSCRSMVIVSSFSELQATKTFLQTILGLPHYSKSKFCWYCPCDTDGVVEWNDFTQAAQYKSMLFTVQDARANPASACPFVRGAWNYTALGPGRCIARVRSMWSLRSHRCEYDVLNRFRPSGPRTSRCRRQDMERDARHL